MQIFCVPICDIHTEKRRLKQIHFQWSQLMSVYDKSDYIISLMFCYLQKQKQNTHTYTLVSDKYNNGCLVSPYHLPFHRIARYFEFVNIGEGHRRQLAFFFIFYQV